MFLDPRTLAAVLLLAGIASAQAGEARTQPTRRLCPEDAPEGVRLPPQPGCAASSDPAKAARDDGFRDVGGIKVRVGGRVGAEYGIGR